MGRLVRVVANARSEAPEQPCGGVGIPGAPQARPGRADDIKACRSLGGADVWARLVADPCGGAVVRGSRTLSGGCG